MNFLFNPDGYFNDKTDLPFWLGFAAVFLTGGFTFVTSIVTYTWVAQSQGKTVTNLINNTDLAELTYPFYAPLVEWVSISIILFLLINFQGSSTVDFSSITSMTSLGFIPLALAAAGELISTVYLINKTSSVGVVATKNILLTGTFSFEILIGTIILYVIATIWSGHIWVGGVSQYGGVSSRVATLFVGIVVIGLLTELVFASVV